MKEKTYGPKTGRVLTALQLFGLFVKIILMPRLEMQVEEKEIKDADLCNIPKGSPIRKITITVTEKR